MFRSATIRSELSLLAGLGLIAGLLLFACATSHPARERGEVLVRQGKHAQAVEHYEKALAQHPGDLTLMTGLGEALLYDGQLEAAEKVLLEAEAKGDPHDAPLLLGRLRRWQGRYQQAAEWLGPLVKRYPEDAEVHLELGRLRLEGGDVAASIEPLQAACMLDPRLVEAHVQLSVALRKENRITEAVDVLQSARTRFGGSARARMEAALGELHEAAGELTAADRAYQRALNRDPKLQQAVAGRARMLRRSQEYAAAIELLQRASHHHPKSAALSWELAETYAAYGMPDQALAAYEQTLAHDPAWTRAYRPWIELLETRAKSPQARFEALRRAAQHVDNDLDLQVRFVKEAHARKQHREALPVARRILDAQPSHVEANYYLGLLQAELGQTQEASDSYEALLVLDREKAELLRQAIEKGEQRVTPERAATAEPAPKKKQRRKRRRQRR